MGLVSYSEDNAEAIDDKRFLPDRPASAPVSVERMAERRRVEWIEQRREEIRRSTPAGAKAGAAANRGRACRASLELLRGHINQQRSG